MINQTPLDTTPNTPLDAIKAAYLRGHDRISSATDSLVGSHEISEDADAIGLLDEADYALAVLVCEALGYDKPPRGWVPTRQSAPSLFTYDDGSPIYYGTTVAPGVSFVIWPRFDSRETLEAIFGYSIELAYREPHGTVAPITYIPTNQGGIA